MRATCMVAIALAVSAAGARAQDAVDENAADSKWSGQVTLYGWFPGIRGDQKFPNGDPAVDLDSSDVLDALEGAFFGTAELRRDRFGLIVDLSYADLGQDGRAAGTIIPGADPANASVDTTFWMVTGVLAYRPYEEEGRSFDIYAGLRYYDIDADFKFRIPSIGFESSRGASPSWVDGVVGLRGHLPLGHGFSVSALADVGGFGIGDSSNLSWEVLGTLDYAFTDNIIGRAGYRYMSIDNDQNGLDLDLELYGPMLGLTAKF